MSVATHIAKATAAGGDAVAIEFDGASLSWRALALAITSLGNLLSSHGVKVSETVGLLGRNRLEQVGSFITVLGTGYCVTLVNASRAHSLIADEVRGLGLSCLIGSADDLSADVRAPAKSCGTLIVVAKVEGDRLLFDVASSLGDGPFRQRPEGTLIEIQTSGTTGVPKRIPILERTLEESLKDGVRTARGAVVQDDLKPKSSPTLMFSPLVHTSGTFNTLMSAFEVRPIVLFEKFDPERYREALVRYRPKFLPLPPSALKMMLDSSATRQDFESVRAVRAGTAPLPTDMQEAFEERFGVPVLTTYGATEFAGVVSSWTLDEYQRFGKTKRGSVGRVSKGVSVRIVDVATNEELPPNKEGIVEARLDRIDGGKSWIRTTDIGRIDEDGFLYIVGRADDAIIRGGFKIMASKVADALRKHPKIADAFVLGIPDSRLGEVPIAVLEPWTSDVLPSREDLRTHSKQLLSPYEVPAEFHFVDRMPTTVSDKISKPAVRELLANRQTTLAG